MAASNTTNTLKDGTKKRIRYYSCSNFRNKGSKVCSANSVRADVIEDYVMKQILEIVKSDKVIQRVVARVNQENKVDGAALHHDIAYKQQQYDEVQTKLNNLIKTIEDNPDLTSVIRPSIQKYEKQLNDITNQINQLKINKMKISLYLMPNKSVNYYNTSFKILSTWKNLDSKHCIYQ